MRKWLTFILMGLLLLSGTSALAKAEYAPGDVLTLGHYEQDHQIENGLEVLEWYILDIQNGQALLISKYGLERKSYHQDFSRFISWEESDIRSWLNGRFFETAFTEDERSLILETVVHNGTEEVEGLPWAQFLLQEALDSRLLQEGDLEDSIDQLFLLSYAEYRRYLWDPEEAESRFYDGEYDYYENYSYGGATEYAAAKDSFNDGYWLRTSLWNNASLEAEALTVNITGFMDGFGIESIRLDNEDGHFNYLVRPCMWINLKAYLSDFS